MPTSQGPTTNIHLPNVYKSIPTDSHYNDFPVPLQNKMLAQEANAPKTNMADVSP